MYSYDKYLRTLSPTDSNIQIMNNDGIIIWTIEPYNVLNTMVNNNLLKINLVNRVIILTFSSNNEALLALTRFQEYLDELKSRDPLLIDKKLENILNSRLDVIKDEIKNLVNDSVDFNDFKNKISNL